MRSIKEKKNMDLIAVFRLFVRTLPIHFALLGRKRKYIKSKTTTKLKEKRTSIAAVWDILRMFDTFPNPLVPRVQRKEDQVRLVAPTQMALCLRPCLLRLLRRELLRAFATLDDSTPQRRISELRVWSYEPFIVFAPSSSGYTSGQNLD